MEDAKAVLLKMVEMFATGDLDVLGSVVSADYVDHQGFGGRELHGPEGFAWLVGAVHAQKVPTRVTIVDLFGEDDKAAARLRWHHTEEDGAVIERETIDLIRCAHGHAVEHWGAEIVRG